MKQTRYLIVISLCVLLLLSACKGGNGPATAPKNPFIGGTIGLVLNFEKDAPPPEVVDGSSFPFKVTVSLQNQGEAKVTRDDVDLEISGFFPRDFGIADDNLLRHQKPDEELVAKTRDSDGKIIDGTTAFVNVPKDSNTFFNVIRLTGNNEYTIRADVCYKYQSKGVANICVLRDFINVGQDDLCDPNNAQTVFSSSAPVQFTNFRQSVQGVDKVMFNFDVVHSGNGEVYEDVRQDTGTGPSCPRDEIRLRRTRLDKVKIKIDLKDEVLNQGLSCNIESGGQNKNEGFVRLISGKRTVTCTVDLKEKHTSDFEKSIELSADYNYFDNKETQILVKHLPDFG